MTMDYFLRGNRPQIDYIRFQIYEQQTRATKLMRLHQYMALA